MTLNRSPTFTHPLIHEQLQTKPTRRMHYVPSPIINTHFKSPTYINTHTHTPFRLSHLKQPNTTPFLHKANPQTNPVHYQHTVPMQLPNRDLNSRPNTFLGPLISKLINPPNSNNSVLKKWFTYHTHTLLSIFQPSDQTHPLLIAGAFLIENKIHLTHLSTHAHTHTTQQQTHPPLTPKSTVSAFDDGLG